MISDYTNTVMVHMGKVPEHPPLYEGDDQVVVAIQTSPPQIH